MFVLRNVSLEGAAGYLRNIYRPSQQVLLFERLRQFRDR